GVFAIPAGVGDLLTGLFAPLIAYWWVAGKPYARTAAIAWNMFGIADLVNAVVLGGLTGGGGGGGVLPRRRYPNLTLCAGRADPDLRRAARIPGPFLFADRPAAQNLAPFRASGNRCITASRRRGRDRAGNQIGRRRHNPEAGGAPARAARALTKPASRSSDV